MFYHFVVRASAKTHESLKKLKNFFFKKCEACKNTEKMIINVKKRKFFKKLHFNNLMTNKRKYQASRILFKCALCKIFFYNHKQC